MVSRNSATFFSDDFSSDLFTEADMEFGEFQDSQDSLSSLIRLLEDEKDIHKRLASAQKLLLECVPATSVIDVDKKILQHAMPAIKGLLHDIFSEISFLCAGDNLDKSVATFNILQEYLQMCLNILEMLNTVIEYILKNESIDMCYIKNVPLNMIQILHLTFQHCKDSEKLYKGYLGDLKEILSLFKIAQNAHAKLLNLLEKHVVVNQSLEEEVLLIQNILVELGIIGEILIDMNIKPLADNWKSYVVLTQKFAELLNQNSFSINGPLLFLASEISRNLDNVLKMDTKNYNQTLKICNFFVKIALKLCDTFWSNLEQIVDGIWNFMMQIYKFYPPFLKFSGCSENVVDQIESLIFVGCDSVLHKMVYERALLKVLSTINIQKETSVELLFLLSSVFQKLSMVIENDAEALRVCQVGGLINSFFDVAKKSYCQLFWKIRMPTSSVEKQFLYDANVKNITLIVRSLNQEQYHQIEVLLLKNVLQDLVWCALLATDIYCSVLRSKNPKFIHETVCNIIAKTQPLLMNNFTDRPETVFLGSLLKRLYKCLPDDRKMLLINTFPPSLLNLHIWQFLGFSGFPKTQGFLIESLLINIMEKIEEFLKGKCNVDDFHLLCSGFQAIASLSNENNINLRHLLTLIINLWNYDVNGSMKNSSLFRQFLQKLCEVTDAFIVHLSNEQLLLVLTKLKQLIDSDFNIKIRSIHILRSLAAKSFAQSPEQNQITILMSEIFRALLLDSNPIIKQHTLEAFVHVLSTPHEDIIQNTVKNEKQLQGIVSNFIKKTVSDSGTIGSEEYFATQKEYKFQHNCLSFPQITELNLGINRNEVELSSAQKKFKIDNVEIELVVNRIKNDVELLHKLNGKESIAKENVALIINILSQQMNCNF